MAKAKQKKSLKFRRNLIIVVVLLLLIAGVAGAVAHAPGKKHGECMPRGDGTAFCLPAGECFAPNDGPMSCDVRESN